MNILIRTALAALLAIGTWGCDGGTDIAPDPTTRDMASQDMATPDAATADARAADATPEDAQTSAADAIVMDASIMDSRASDMLVGALDLGPLADRGSDPDQGLALDQGPPPVASPVYEPGPFAVQTTRLAEGEGDAPRTLDIYAPMDAPAAPVIVWQHGFLLDVGLYSDMLTHVASHGFVVVAPQMYPADNNPIGKPTAVQEAATAATILAWIDGSLSPAIDAPLAPGAPGIAGHSRGGKVTWLLMIDDASRGRAVAGVDPVDGQGGPLGGEARALDNEIDFGGVPSLVLGTGLGGMPINAFAPACAPQGDAHARFYARTSAPAWHGVATGHGHNDMLNDEGCGFLCLACAEGPDRASMRRYVAGQLVAHFSAALRGDADAIRVLETPAAAPLPATAERR